MPKPKATFTATSFQGFLVLDGEAQLWTSAVFNTPAAAANYMQDKANRVGGDFSKHKIVPCVASVRVTEFP